jgi:hypothetical protein
MPLNISIDVDGTLLDVNEKPVPQARESIQKLKDAGHCLQLWSGGGAEYAEKIARKFNLAHLFDSYAKKIDVAIDDIPETAHPSVVLHVDQEHTLQQAVEEVFRIEQNVDAALTLNSSLVNFVGQLQAEENSFRGEYGAILRPGIPLHPIPFFGVVEHAKVITVGLNPSSTEFVDGRWPTTPLTSCELTRRLVDYFRLSHTPPHHWFAELQWSLEILRCPYSLAAAHVDLSPWTTYAPTSLQRNRPAALPLYDEMLNAGIQNSLPKTLEFCEATAKLVIICCRNTQAIEQAIRQSLGQNVTIVVMSKNKVPQWAWENRDELIRLLDVENIFP